MFVFSSAQVGVTARFISIVDYFHSGSEWFFVVFATFQGISEKEANETILDWNAPMTLKRLLKVKRLKQEDLARQLGTTQGAVSKYVNSNLTLPLQFAVRIGRLTNTQPIPKEDGNFDFKQRKKARAS